MNILVLLVILTNMDEITKLLQQLQKDIKDLQGKRINRTGIIPGSIQQLHMSANTAILVIGKSANRPTKGSNTCLFYFATDTGVMSAWNNSAWKTATFS